MIRRQVDPGQLRGSALDEWYRRSPDEIEAERRIREDAEYEAFFGDRQASRSWQEAKTAQARRPPVQERPSPVRDRAKVASPVDGMPVRPGEPGGFFAEASTLGGDYFNPNFPEPLNHVEPVGRDSERTKRYEKQITRAPGLDYVVRIPGRPAVKFDGCGVWDPKRPLCIWP